MPGAPVCVRHTPQFCAHVKDPISICRKRIGLTAGGIDTKQLHTGDKKEAWQRRTMAARFPREKQPVFPVHLHWEKKVISSNLI